MDKKALRPAVFLDRDGVLVRDKGYVYKIEDLEILPSVLPALKFLHERDYLLFIISNQAGVARGYFGCQDVDRFHDELQSRFQRDLGFVLDGIYYCPHHPQGQVAEYAVACGCRKPGISLIEQAKEAFNIDLSRSAMVGDRASDIECGLKAGIKTIQIKSDQYQGHSAPDICVENLYQAAEWLVEQA